MTHPRKAAKPSRRDFLTASAVAIGASTLGGCASTSGPDTPEPAPAEPKTRKTMKRDERTLKLGLIGCGGRGTGAARQALQTKGNVELVAMADVFADHLEDRLGRLSKAEKIKDRVVVPPEQRFIGFDAYEKLLATDVDVVVLATPPHFRPDHFRAAIAAGKHVFMEKPVAVDGAGVRTVLENAALAKKKKLAVVSGLQRHHQNGYLELMERVHGGAIGDIVAARCYWNMGSLWMKPRDASWSDMEWQMRNWLYFTWLSGDHIVEQHVHNLDVVNWAKQAHPVRCHGMGGRQTRTDAAYGHIFDHHAVHYEYPDGSWLFSQCRQQKGCRNQVSEHLIGTKGRADTNRGWVIQGENPWKFKGKKNNPYQTEHDDMFESIRTEQPLNEGQFVAEATLTAIMGRMATYTGREVSWEEALASERLGPTEYTWGKLPVPPVPTPGVKA